MDVRNLSNQESPLYNTLTRKTERSPWTYNLLESVGSFSKQRVVVPPDTDCADFMQNSTSCHWDVPRYGLLGHVMIRTEFLVDGAADDTEATQNLFCDDFGLHLYPEISLRTNNKIVQILYPEPTMARIKELPYEKRVSMEAATGKNGRTLQSNVNDTERLITVYTPCFFSFMERTNSFLDTAFLENMQIHATVAKSTTVCKMNSTQTIKIQPGNPKLVCTFFNPTDAAYKAAEERNFSMDAPSTFLAYDTYKENPKIHKSQTLSAATSTVNNYKYSHRQQATVKLANPNLTLVTHVCVRVKQPDAGLASAVGANILRWFDGKNLRTMESTAANSFVPSQNSEFLLDSQPSHFLPIQNITVKGSSREIMNVPGFELQHFDTAAMGRSTQGSLSVSSAALDLFSYTNLHNSDLSDNIYSIHWGLDASRSTCSGACSFKNMTNPEIVIEFDGVDARNATTADDSKFEVLVFHEYFQIMSVQGSDGRIGLGISV